MKLGRITPPTGHTSISALHRWAERREVVRADTAYARSRNWNPRKYVQHRFHMEIQSLLHLATL